MDDIIRFWMLLLAIIVILYVIPFFIICKFVSLKYGVKYIDLLHKCCKPANDLGMMLIPLVIFKTLLSDGVLMNINFLPFLIVGLMWGMGWIVLFLLDLFNFIFFLRGLSNPKVTQKDAVVFRENIVLKVSDVEHYLTDIQKEALAVIEHDIEEAKKCQG